MNSNTNGTDRTAALRRELVSTVDATPRSRRRIEPRVAIASIAAFVLAGAVTGGAISTAAIASSADSATPLTLNAQSLANDLVGTHTDVIGTPFLLAGQGKTTIDLGAKPDGANSLAVALECLVAGRFTTSVNGQDQSWLTCTDDDAADFGTGSAGGMSSTYDVLDEGTQSLVISGEGRYVVWAAWVALPAETETSADQEAALVDGTVTRAEYEEAFDRFVDCMSEAGEPVTGINRSGTVIDYVTTGTAAASGVDLVCYTGQFELVDSTWQIAHE